MFQIKLVRLHFYYRHLKVKNVVDKLLSSQKLNEVILRFITLPWNLPSWKSNEEFPKDAIYYHSTTLCHTLNNLKVDQIVNFRVA